MITTLLILMSKSRFGMGSVEDQIVSNDDKICTGDEEEDCSRQVNKFGTSASPIQDHYRGENSLRRYTKRGIWRK